MSGRARKWAGRLAYALFLLVIVETTLQAYYWVTAGQPLWTRVARPMYAPDPDTGYWNKPNLSLHHKTNEFDIEARNNSQGLRVAEGSELYAPGRDPSLFRIVLMGPSFAYGWGVNYPDTFAARLEQRLTEARFAGGRRVQVINAGVPGMGPAGNLTWFEHEGKDFQPDLVIQFIYGSMIVPRANWTDVEVNDEGYLVSKNRDRLTRARDLAKNSGIVFYGWTAWMRLRGSSRVAGAGRPMDVPATSHESASKVGEAEAFYDDLREAVERAHTELLIVHFPLAYGVHAEDLARWRHLGVTDPEEERQANDKFCRSLNARGVPCLNITPQLVEEARKGKRLYNWLDIHWTPEGNRAAAHAVADHLMAGSP